MSSRFMQPLENILNFLTAPAFMLDEQGNIEYMNAHVSQALPRLDANSGVRTLQELLAPEAADELPVLLTELVAEEPQEVEIPWRDGHSSPALFARYGNSIICMLRPPGENARYGSFFEASGTIRLLVDSQSGAIRAANPAAETFFASSEALLTERSLLDYYRTSASEIQRALNSSSSSTTLRKVRQAGLYSSEHFVDLTFTPSIAALNGERLVEVCVHDVTHLARLNDALSRSERLFRRLIEFFSQGLLVDDEDGRIVYVNSPFCQMIGYEPQELIGKPIEMLTSEKDLAKLREEVNSRRGGHSSTYEMVFRHREGEPRFAIVSAAPIQGGKGAYKGSFAMVTDITDRKAMEEALRQNNSELDAFAHTVAHDLKDPISIVLTGGYLLSDINSLSPEQMEETVQTIIQTAHKMVNIIDELMLLSRLRSSEVQSDPLSMGDIVREAEHRLMFMVSNSQAEIIKPEEGAWPLALGYSPWVEAVWVNYISNAIKYGGRPPRVELGATVEGNVARFWVRDNGPGIPKEKQTRLFNTFERLDQVRARGHGLGLSIVQRIVHKLGGSVGVWSEEGEGSIFSFTLPLAPQETDIAAGV